MTTRVKITNDDDSHQNIVVQGGQTMHTLKPGESCDEFVYDGHALTVVEVVAGNLHGVAGAGTSV